MILCTLFLCSCYALNHPKDTIQPVITLDESQQIYKATCSGLVETWPDCLTKAKETCKNGYSEIDRVITSAGARRELKFGCKK